MKLSKELKQIKQDCLRLEKEGKLTEHGEGELEIIRKVEKMTALTGQKYKLQDLAKIGKEERAAAVGIMIANEIREVKLELRKRNKQ